MQNKPNFADRGGAGGTARAKQSQFAAEGKKWQVLDGERVMVDLPPEQPRQNKANFRPDRGPAGGSQGAGGTNKTPTTEVRESAFDPHFRADTKDRFG
jgi:hypothetical protein